MTKQRYPEVQSNKCAMPASHCRITIRAAEYAPICVISASHLLFEELIDRKDVHSCDEILLSEMCWIHWDCRLCRCQPIYFQQPAPSRGRTIVAPVRKAMPKANRRTLVSEIAGFEW
jgi:hypothetical protein